MKVGTDDKGETVCHTHHLCDILCGQASTLSLPCWDKLVVSSSLPMLNNTMRTSRSKENWST